MRTENLSVLIADDHPIIGAGFKALLEKVASVKKIVCVANGKEAFDKIRYQRFDVLFLDLDMPILDGFGLIELLKEERNQLTHFPKIIIVSVHQNLHRIKKCYQMGADGYIHKSVSIQELNRLFSILSEDELFFASDIRKNLMDYFFGVAKDRSKQFPSRLDPKDLEIIRLTTQQYTLKEIATTLELSLDTIKSRRSSLYRKLGVKNMVGVTVVALQNGWIMLNEITEVDH